MDLHGLPEEISAATRMIAEIVEQGSFENQSKLLKQQLNECMAENESLKQLVAKSSVNSNALEMLRQMLDKMKEEVGACEDQLKEKDGEIESIK